ncbi:hypothetical protein [Aldersonia kunmingensis]|uniref:hypothetical protein n=1 Tax=Aldersonia kunmingensis TaxID=408066 RepID=UPI000832A254|nr:hypothetical protein [Aldersonia kunmingensis]
MSDRDVLEYTLDWASSNHYAITTAQILTELISVARRHINPFDRDAAMHTAAARLEARANELALSGSAL